MSPVLDQLDTVKYGITTGPYRENKGGKRLTEQESGCSASGIKGKQEGQDKKTVKWTKGVIFTDQMDQ